MQIQNNKNKFNPFSLIIFILFIAFSISPILGGILLIIGIAFIVKNPKYLSSYILNLQKNIQLRNNLNNNSDVNSLSIQNLLVQNKEVVQIQTPNMLIKQARLEKRKKYLHIALNNTLEEAREIISRLPVSDRILIEAGTPLIKIYGTNAISQIKLMAPVGTYIVADNKCADLAAREVKMMANAGANASTCLGVAPIETIDSFIEECEKAGIDSMVDMMNVEDVFSVLKKLKKLPNVVILHRGVDETEFSREKQIPFYQIKQIKGSYDVLVSVAGGDTIRETQRAVFNDADIVVVWKNFYQSNTETAVLAESFLQEIK